MGVLAIAVFACTAATAFATAVVSTGAGPSLTVKVSPVSGPDGNHQMAIQPGAGTVRVGQLAFGDPAIRSTDERCQLDSLSNRVDCPVFPTSIALTMGDGADRIQVGPSLAPANECVPRASPPQIAVTGSLGAGEDKLSVAAALNPGSEGCPLGSFARGSFEPKLTVDGGSGADDIRGGPLPDTLSGGTENDVLLGEEGNDTLNGGPGNDELEGESGDDVITDTSGADVLHGNDGNDKLAGGGGGSDKLFGDFGDDYFNENVSNPSQEIDGGPGFDTVDFSARQLPLVITIGNPTTGDGTRLTEDPDGPNEGNNIVDAERILGGNGNDIMIGSDASETLVGNGGDDILDGGFGADTLQGGAGDDTLQGKGHLPGFDSKNFQGGADDDSIAANNGVPDTVSCGDGNDSATVDLKDTVATHVVSTPFGVLVLPDCEELARAPVDDSPPGRPRARAIRLVHRAATVPFRCPKTSRPGCTGQLFLQDARRGGKVLGHVGYELQLGRTRTLRVPLGRRALAILRHEHRTIVRTVEHGHSQIGPRGAEIVARVIGR
ncbi:MAG TPA: calcium-binding protein [Solirubrobacteraceae bacterium]|nr:calcium-binding protein [Solirubrobacteraceae bacterium]